MQLCRIFLCFLGAKLVHLHCFKMPRKVCQCRCVTFALGEMRAVVAGVAADRDDGLSDGSSRWDSLRNLPAHKLEKKEEKKKS